MLTQPASDRTRTIWRSRLGSALRTSLACTIVACATLYGPVALQRQISFPALCYVTIILIVTNATLGDTLRGCCYALYATILGVLPAILCLWAIGPARLSAITMSLAVALSAFVIVLPESTHLITKRIALAQVVLVYVVAYINGVHTGAITHPVHVAASTAIGALASVVALLLPYPRLACHEVRKKCKLFAETASERLNHLVHAFCADEKTSTLASLSQAKSLSKTEAKLLQSIKLKQESMQWERPRISFFQHHCTSRGDRLQGIEISLRGMEIALTSCPSFSVKVLADEEHKSFLHALQKHVSLTLKRANLYLPSCDSSTTPEIKGSEAVDDKFMQILQVVFPTYKDLPSLFFLFCLKLLHNELTGTPTPSNGISLGNSSAPCTQYGTRSSKQSWGAILSHWPVKIGKRRLILAFKRALSLGLSVLFGTMFSKEDGYWSGLTVAVGMAWGREATFKVANVKAQGTVLGTVYGVLGCFIFQRFEDIRFLSFLPWIIFTSFLGRSRMYGQAGGISAVIAALIILGRKNYGPPSAFAIVRIMETFIGLSCSIMVELLLQPTRAVTLAKVEFCRSLGTLHDCIQCISFSSSHTNDDYPCLQELNEKQKKLTTHVTELANFIAEAEVEPNFWFLPFHSICYGKLLKSLSKMVDFLLFGSHAMGFIVQASQRCRVPWKEIQEHIDEDLQLFKDKIGCAIKCFEQATSIKSLAALEKELWKNIPRDLEFGKSPKPDGFRVLDADTDEDEDEDKVEEMLTSFLQHSREIIDKFHAAEAEEGLKSQMILCLSALGFCLGGLIKETREMENGIRELVQWENPSSRINLYEISCKIHALNT
ncbi:PREDICTED: uncharacterized protein LOC104594975 [Nelumbo nucifera]|uniref:Integral membrane bound transporter domain-containing protein n=2 Tax=Nelumbo nucifera TaxID=4432 RepID=A0A822Y3T3_NELNU|nr:PREDICTED: uncharacterized protein LOC104594975 [Nelumbo nucifera]DAD25876.1 TPA_asm: hypothetical protein HUJ06_027344 [Nelumbo nucifera]